jgi:O-methyltransferase involved in polyketide biosynthesis
MPIARDAKIAPTAHYTAYVWRRLKLPYADAYATRKGAAMYWSMRLAGEWIADAIPTVPSMTQYLALRHLAIDHALDEIAPDRVVEIGAGLSRRGTTWALDRDVAYLEVDLPHMVAHKRAAIEARFQGALGEQLRRRLSVIAHDVLAPDFTGWLEGVLRGAERPVVIAEGVMGYFPIAERLRIARATASALAPAGGSFLCDLRASEGGRSIAIAARLLKGGIKLATRGRGVAEDFARADDVRAFFAEAGFRSCAPIDETKVPGAPRVPSPARVWRAIAG